MFLILILLLTACGSHPNPDVDCIDGCNHKDKDQKDKTKTQVVVGPVGPQGQRGPQGDSCTTKPVSGGAKIICEDGSETFISDGSDGEDGQDGEDGVDGVDGIDGEDGTSCSVDQVSNGAIIECGDGSNALIVNGEDGEDGADGQDAEPGAYTFTEMIDPCGPESSFDEVIFRTYGGDLVALYFSKNKKESFLTTISPGDYRTTDGTNCRFTVTDDLEVTW